MTLTYKRLTRTLEMRCKIDTEFECQESRWDVNGTGLPPDPLGCWGYKKHPSLQALRTLCLQSGAKAGGKTRLRCGRAPHEGEPQPVTCVRHPLKGWENTCIRCHRAGAEC